MIESLSKMNISMDKYKTSELGQALKKVYRGEIEISDSVELAKKEISEVFKRDSLPPVREIDTGFYGDKVGKCPLCGKDVIRNRFGYGCTGYKDGCKFKINGTICGRDISLTNARLLTETGKTSKIEGFVSKKSGKTFSAYLKLDENKNVVFEF